MATPEGSAATVLVADDDALVRSVLRMALAGRGYRVIEASDAVEALDAVRSQHCDLVVLDIIMPGGSVHNTLNALRHHDARLPVLVLSGDASPALDLGLSTIEFARKPIELDEFLDRITRLLAQSNVGE